MITITMVGRGTEDLKKTAYTFRTNDEYEALQRFAKKQHVKAGFRVDSRDGQHIDGSLMGIPGYGRGIKCEVVVS